MGQCWGGIKNKLRPQDLKNEENCLIDMRWGSWSEDLESSGRTEGGLGRGELAGKSQGKHRFCPSAVLSARWLDASSTRPGVLQSGYNRLSSPSVPGQSCRGSIASLDLEWDSRDCFKHLVDENPQVSSHQARQPPCGSELHRSPSTTLPHTLTVRPNGAVLTLDNQNCSVLYTVTPGPPLSSQASSVTSLAWDGQTELQVKEESGHVELDTETENLLHQIEELTSTALRETNHWSLHINHDTNNPRGHAGEQMGGVQEGVVENNRNSLSGHMLGLEDSTAKEDSNFTHGHRGGRMNKTGESQAYSNANNRLDHNVRRWYSGTYSDTPNTLVTVIEQSANNEAVTTPMSISTSSCESVTGTTRDNIP